MMKEILTIAPWIGGLLSIVLAYACFKKPLRSIAVATLLLSIPLAVLIAINNTHTNAVSNFFIGIALFGIPLLLHTGVVSYLDRKWAPK